ncbi:unnamed protein product [Caenorhabditis bovis]|uniref:Uncharacterized protein n=1 Tax=Caenorhabditis bovis TaxID=2654633 RepID=A0A8S1F0R7_9PELO|nr:unnamed protein product [Caenorhabditis bovis]
MPLTRRSAMKRKSTEHAGEAESPKRLRFSEAVKEIHVENVEETMLRNHGIRVTRPAFFMDMKEEFCNENNHNFEKSLLIQPPFMKDDSNCSLPDSVNYSMNDLGFNTQNDEISQRYDAIAKMVSLKKPSPIRHQCLKFHNRRDRNGWPLNELGATFDQCMPATSCKETASRPESDEN